MIGSPVDGAWTDSVESYYTGLGSGEAIWLIVAIVICLVALFMGGKHESDSYKK